jgi:WD40 repeat protein
MVRQLPISALTSARFSPDGSALVITRGIVPEADEDRDIIQIYDPRNLKKLGKVDVDLEYITDCAFSTDGKTLTISGGESLSDIPADKGGKQRNRIEIWDLSPPSATQPNTIPHELAKLRTSIGESPRLLLCPVYSGGGRLIAAASGDWLVWETKSGKQIATLRAPRYEARSCAISPNTRWIATGAIDSTVALFDTRQWEMRYQNQADPSQDVTAMVFTPEGNMLIAARGTVVDLFVVAGR